MNELYLTDEDIHALDEPSDEEKEIERLNKIIEKLEGLDGVYNKAMGIFESGNAGVSAFSSEAKIQSSGKYVYNK